MSRPIESIRNIGIIAHIDAGKTTTTERILYYSGASHRMGNVDDGTTAPDFDPEEAKRGITIYSAAVTCHWNDATINIIDTPGHVDFTAEVERSLRVLDGGVVIFSAVEGVEAQSETVWRQADWYRVPRICFINKMDRIGADFERTFDEIRDRLGAKPLALQIPIGAGSPPDPNAFRGIIDLVEMKALYFDSESKGEKVQIEEIPEDLLETAREWQQRLLETVSLLDDDVLEAMVNEQPVPAETIHRVLRVATIHGELHPTFCGASLDYIGVQPILDAIVRYLPSPADRPPVSGEQPKRKKGGEKAPSELVRHATADDPFCGLIFKIQADQHSDMCFVRVYSGVLKSGSRVLNARTGKKEFVSQLWHIQADSRKKTEAVEAGDIIGVIGPKDSVTGDTICDAREPILLETIQFPDTVISMAVEPESNAERKKLADVLTRLGREDPTFEARISEETGQTIISGMGELHLEVIRNKIQRDYGLDVRVHKPRVSYRETVQKGVTADGEFSRQVQGVTQFAAVTLKIEPFVGEESICVEDALKPGDLPGDLLAVLEQSVSDRARGSGSVGFPLMHVKLTLAGARYREGETTELAIQAAAADAFDKAIHEAGVVLLEPVMKLEVVTTRGVSGQYSGRFEYAAGHHCELDQAGRLVCFGGRSGSAGDVRILDSDSQPVAGPRQLLDGTAEVRRGARGSVGANHGDAMTRHPRTGWGPKGDLGSKKDARAAGRFDRSNGPPRWAFRLSSNSFACREMEIKSFRRNCAAVS